MKIKVEKVKFYKGENKHIRFIESTEENSCKDHFDCGCTETVKEKPITRLLSTSNIITAFINFGKYQIEFGFDGCWTIRWEDKHAYFWVSDTDNMYSSNSIYIEIYKEGWNSVDYFFSRVFHGPHHRIDTLMNGHSPSRVINLNDISNEDLWIHECNWGKEHWLKFSDIDNRERSKWIEFLKITKILKNCISKFRPESEYSVSEIKEILENEKGLSDILNKMTEFLISIVENLEETELFELQSIIQSNIKNHGTKH